MKPWKRVAPTSVKMAGYRTIVEKSFIGPAGEEISFTTVSPEGSTDVGVVALTKDNKVVIARQYRPGPECIFDEMPGGGVDNDEDLTRAAFRELKEETGYTSEGSIEYLGVVCNDAYSNSRHHYFLLKDCYKITTIDNDEYEYTEPIEISIAQFIDNAKKYRMSDAAGVLLAYEALMELTDEKAN